MSRYRSSDPQCKLYVGDLARDTTEKDLERAFNYYGPLKSVWVARNPAGFGFVEYEDRRDADDAVNGLDGSTICGSRVRVEHSSDRPKSRSRGGGFGGGRGGGFRGGRARPFNPDDRCYQCGESGHYAYDCTNAAGGSSRRGGGGGGGGYGRRSSRHSRSRSGSPKRSSYRRSYSRSRSRDRKRSRSGSRSSSRSPPRKGGD